MNDGIQKQKHICGRGKLTSPGRMQGSVFIKIVVLIPLALIVLLALVFAFYEGRKAYWDHRVREMCEKDGGIKIYVHAVLPTKYKSEDGSIRIPFEIHATENDEYFIRTKHTPIVEGKLSVGKHETELIRSDDGAVLGKVITYGRGGGDFPTYAHPSSLLCPTNGNPMDAMIRQVFSKG